MSSAEVLFFSLLNAEIASGKNLVKITSFNSHIFAVFAFHETYHYNLQTEDLKRQKNKCQIQAP